MKSHIGCAIKCSNGLKNSKLPGGFKGRFYMHEDVYLKSIELQAKCDSRRAVKSLLCEDVCIIALDALCVLLNQRFKSDDKILDKITPFINFSSNTDIE